MKEKRKLLMELFTSTLYLSAFTFGGGYVIVSLLKERFVDQLHYIEEKEMLDLVAIAQSAPGAIAVNGAIVLGYKMAGILGIIVCVDVYKRQVLNPTLLIPFVLVPTVNIVISYFAMAMNLVPICSGINIPWTTPIVISGFLATNWAGALLQVLLLILGIFIYMPFIKIMDKQYLEEENNMQNDEEEEDDISLDDLSFDDL